MKHATRTQDLREAFASIISMILGLLRAHGLRGLLPLPTLWMVAREIRRIGEELVALYDAFKAGTLPPVPAPAPWPAPQQPQAAPTQPPATPRASARPAALRVRRPRPQPVPAKPARAGVRARTRTVRRRSTPDPFPAPPGIVRATA